MVYSLKVLKWKTIEYYKQYWTNIIRIFPSLVLFQEKLSVYKTKLFNKYSNCWIAFVDHGAIMRK